jgi:hypothetical protein
MTAAAEQVLEKAMTLPASDLRAVWQCLSENVSRAAPSLPGNGEDALAAVHSLYGRFAGGDSLVRLLQERARDRDREHDKLGRLSLRHA